MSLRHLGDSRQDVLYQKIRVLSIPFFIFFKNSASRARTRTYYTVKSHLSSKRGSLLISAFETELNEILNFFEKNACFLE